MSTVECVYFPKCSGCQLIDKKYSEQISQKENILKEILCRYDIEFPKINFLSSSESHLRDRFDFVWEDKRQGLYSHSEKQILDIEYCQQLSPALQSWYTEVRKINWPIKKGSIRIRVGPQGQKGIWLDFANLDIKRLLEEKVILTALLEKASVEIGQKRKFLKKIDNDLKLVEPEYLAWFETYTGEQKIDLYGNIASFTQPSMKANQIITNTISNWIKNKNVNHIVEFGSGLGNLSIPAATYAQTLTACESDELALGAFQKTLEVCDRNNKTSLANKIIFSSGDFQNKIKINFDQYDLVLVNPPRSGLKEFILPLVNSQKIPKYFIYMSCFPESFAIDAQHIKKRGYKIDEIVIVDQFPQTDHFEVLSLWSI